MYLSAAVLAALPYAALILADADPMVTPAPAPAHKDLIRAELLKRRMAALPRQLDDLHFCYDDGSICDAANSLNDKCEPFEDDQDLTQWYQCICENGWVSADQACHWCDAYYDIPYLDIYAMNTEECSSQGFTVAPVPSSILAAQSEYNATQTDPPTGATNTGAGAKPTVSSSGAARSTRPVNTGTLSSSQASSSTITLAGGGGSLLPSPTLPSTLAPLVSNTLTAPSVTGTLRSGGDSGSSSGSSTGNGAAPGLNSFNALLFTVVGVMWCLIFGGL